MIINKRLSKVYKQSTEIGINDNSKIIMFSDCHRGGNWWFDDFNHNKHIFLHALNHYYQAGFTYIEIGDGDELWKNGNFSKIFKKHEDVFLLMRKFHDEQRLLLLWGNHDMMKKNEKFIKNKLNYFQNEVTNTKEELFKNIKTYEGLKLKYKNAKNLFILHGHQGDLFADQLWLVGRFFVRYFWRYLQLINIHHPDSPAEDINKRRWLIKKLKKWVNMHDQPTIFGHTHQYALPQYDKTPYFNTGCCVYHRCITGIEIEKGKITLTKWSINTQADGELKVVKNILEGPRDINRY